MEAPKTKFIVGQKAYAFTKEGLQNLEIQKIIIRINNNATTVYYAFDEYGELYEEHQIIEDYPSAKKKLKENSNQLVLALN